MEASEALKGLRAEMAKAEADRARAERESKELYRRVSELESQLAQPQPVTVLVQREMEAQSRRQES